MMQAAMFKCHRFVQSLVVSSIGIVSPHIAGDPAYLIVRFNPQESIKVSWRWSTLNNIFYVFHFLYLIFRYDKCTSL